MSRIWEFLSSDAFMLVSRVGLPLFYVVMSLSTIRRYRRMSRSLANAHIVIGGLTTVPQAMVVRLIDAGYDPDQLRTLFEDIQVQVPEEFLPKREQKKARKKREVSEKQAKKELIEMAKELHAES